MSARPLAPLFASLLASLTAPGCGWRYDCEIPPRVETKQIPANEVESFSMSGLSETCEQACRYFVERREDRALPGTSTGSGTTGDASTGTTGDASTGTTGDASTGADVTTTGVTTSGTTDLSTGPSAAISTGSSVDPYDDYYDYGGLIDCSSKKLDADTFELTCTYRSLSVCGRRPAGAVDSHPDREPDPERAWLLLAAELEAISIPAFTELAAELARHGAPDELQHAALRAADDERRHAAAMLALARARGCEPAAPHVTPAPASDLEALATHNAVEGCVRETWGALLAAFQARHATADDLRAAQRTIADDECAHAELAWQIDAWARTRLSADAQARVEAARRDAARALAREVDAFAAGLPAVGLPNATQARALLRGLQSALW